MPGGRADIRTIRRGILAWYRNNRRVLRWRDTTDPYEILISEVMLQQTQVERVRKILPRFLERFPTLSALALAPRADVVREWKGMGYNNRAVRLHMAVREVEHRYRGKIPRDIESLDALPGVGRYTAHAVACFSFGARTPVVDVNVRRVLSRLFRKMTAPAGSLSEREAWTIAREVLPADAYTWNQALMDLGSLICTARAPNCLSCPVRSACASSTLHMAKPVPSTLGAKPEPGFNGIPRRIWRGRIVEALRGVKKPLTPGELRRHLMGTDDKRSARFLCEVLSRLEIDGVIAMHRHRGRTCVSLAG